MAKTPMGKAVKMWRICFPDTNLADPQANTPVHASWLLDDDIKLIGVEVTGVINGLGWTALGEKDYVKLDVYAALGSDVPQNGVLAMVYLHMITHDVTIGVGSHLMYNDHTMRKELVMFPEGYGIDFEKGDRLYCAGRITMSGGGTGSVSFLGSANFYYVER